MDTGVRANAPHLVVGLCIMLLGVALILDRLGVVDAAQVLQYWPAGLVLLGASIMVQAARPRPEGTAHRVDVPVGGVILLVLLGVLFTHTLTRRNTTATVGDDRVSVFALMSGDRRTVAAESFRGAELTSVMGGSELDLRQATMTPGQEAVIDVFALMGGAVVRVPPGWTLDIQATSVMGGIRDERRPRPAADAATGDAVASTGGAGVTTAAEGTVPPDDRVIPSVATPPRLILRGFVMMGGLVIRS